MASVDWVPATSSRTDPYSVRTQGVLAALVVALWVIGSWCSDILWGARTTTVLAISFTVVLFFVLWSRQQLRHLEVGVLVQCSGAGLVLGIINLYTSINPVYSVPRVLSSAVLLGMALVVCGRLIERVQKQDSQAAGALNFILSAFFVFLLLGYVLFNEFRGGNGGFRLTGGVNANTVGFLAFTIIVWSFVVVGLRGRWARDVIVLVALAVIVLALSFSRASWLAAGVFLLFVAVFTLFRVVVRRYSSCWELWLVGGCFFVFLIVLGLGVIVWSESVPEFMLKNPVLNYFAKRVGFFHSDANLGSRVEAWNLLLNEFWKNPIFGRLGWYQATRFLSQVSAGKDMAASPHSLHIRLLSEVGIVGYVLALSLPVFSFFMALGRMINYITIGGKFGRARYLLWGSVASGLFAMFAAREVFEDSFMVGYMNHGTMFVAVLIMLALRGVGPAKDN